ncbi:MAG: FAD-dependent oxidoreductase, partial [Candidatus Omnitrophica bacterium]|nr:FAD-dependent oxidoreductase [Candidatus Omnitrophota bacterium]
IAGTGIARLAAEKGLSVLLAEKSTLAAGASSKSTKLIHAGIRYLLNAYNKAHKGEFIDAWKEFIFVFRASRERRRIQETFPDLVQNIPIFIPIYRHNRRGRLITFCGVWLYYFCSLAAGGNLPRPRFLLTKKAVLKKAPQLNPQGLKGGFIYWDSYADDVKLVLENSRVAKEFGAQIQENCEIVQYNFDQDAACYNVTLRDTASLEESVVRARKLVNAAGAWIDQVRQRTDQTKFGRFILPRSGAHLNLKLQVLPLSIVVEVPDGRMVFLINIPESDKSRLGTTEREVSDLEDVKATDEDKEELFTAINQVLASPLTREDILSDDAGVRPLACPSKPTSSSEVSREHKINIDSDGVINVCGVKITDHLRAAREVIKLLGLLSAFALAIYFAAHLGPVTHTSGTELLGKSSVMLGLSGCLYNYVKYKPKSCPDSLDLFPSNPEEGEESGGNGGVPWPYDVARTMDGEPLSFWQAIVVKIVAGVYYLTSFGFKKGFEKLYYADHINIDRIRNYSKIENNIKVWITLQNIKRGGRVRAGPESLFSFLTRLNIKLHGFNIFGCIILNPVDPSQFRRTIIHEILSLSKYSHGYAHGYTYELTRKSDEKLPATGQRAVAVMPAPKTVKIDLYP